MYDIYVCSTKFSQNIYICRYVYIISHVCSLSKLSVHQNSTTSRDIEKLHGGKRVLRDQLSQFFFYLSGGVRVFADSICTAPDLKRNYPIGQWISTQTRRNGFPHRRFLIIPFQTLNGETGLNSESSLHQANECDT